MTIETQKLDVISKIALLQDVLLLSKVKQMLDNAENQKSKSVLPRQAGWGKGIFSNIADDFDATPDGFEEYMPTNK
jgi:hypothetical protein